MRPTAFILLGLLITSSQASVAQVFGPLDASHPLTLDNVVQQAWLKASNTDAGDGFGHSVAISGYTVVVGAAEEDSGATGVNGAQGDNSVDGSGAAYVFVSTGGGTWTQQAYLKASNPDVVDYFGVTVAISGNTLVVGAISEASAATGVDGDGADNSAPQSGAVYVFVRDGTTWSQQAYLKSSNTDALDFFGSALSIDGDTLVVGAPNEESAATGVDGDEDDDSATYAGAAYVFVRDDTTWSQQAYLKASNTDPGDSFGYSVSVSGDTLVVGAIGESSNASGVGGDQADDSVAASGAAYVFTRNGTTWTQQAYIKASNPDFGDDFGVSVSLSGDTLAVGAESESSAATGVDGDQDDDTADQAGAAYVFTRNGTTWTQQAYLKASNTDAGDVFGWHLALSGNGLLVSSFREDSAATGVDGDDSDNTAPDAGAAYLFERDGSTWSQQAYLKASHADAGDWFGWRPAISPCFAVVGAFREGSAATGVDGDASDNSAGGAGAVTVFDLTDEVWSDHGCALAGVTGDPLLMGTGPMTGGTVSSIDLTNAAPNAVIGVFYAFASGLTKFKGGWIKPLPIFDPLITSTDHTGAATLLLPIPAGLPACVELWFQAAIQDNAAIKGVALSNALLGVTP